MIIPIPENKLVVSPPYRYPEFVSTYFMVSIILIICSKVPTTLRHPERVSTYFLVSIVSTICSKVPTTPRHPELVSGSPQQGIPCFMRS